MNNLSLVMFKSVDNHNPTLELTMAKRKVSELLSYSLRKPNSAQLPFNTIKSLRLQFIM